MAVANEESIDQGASNERKYPATARAGGARVPVFRRVEQKLPVALLEPKIEPERPG